MRLRYELLSLFAWCALSLSVAQVGNDNYLGNLNGDDDDDDSASYVDTSPAMTQEILHTFFQSTGGTSSWVNATGWSDYSILDCSYYGVTCYPKDYFDKRRRGQVQAIEMPENSLVGTLPCSIFTLPYLERLVVRNNPDLVVSDLQADGK